MDEKEQLIWNIFHDGEIVELTEIDNSNIEVKIQIEYLRRMISDEGNSFVLKLNNCTLFELEYINRKRITNLDTIQEIKPIILNSKFKNNELLIRSTDGKLKLSYDSSEIYLDNGKEISLEKLVEACGKYWEKLPKGFFLSLPKLLVSALILALILYVIFKYIFGGP